MNQSPRPTNPDSTPLQPAENGCEGVLGVAANPRPTNGERTEDGSRCERKAGRGPSDPVGIIHRGSGATVKVTPQREQTSALLARAAHQVLNLESAQARAVPRLQWIEGMCSDEEPHHVIAAKVAEVIDVLKDAR